MTIVPFTATTTWKAPLDWSDTNSVTFEVVGRGGGGAAGSGGRGGAGGGSGAYSKWSGTFTAASFPITVNVGTTTNIVAGATTYVQATSGANAVGTTQGAGGTASGTTGATNRSGTNGGANSSGAAGGGGAGAPGPHGPGSQGGASSGTFGIGGSGDSGNTSSQSTAGATGVYGAQWPTPFGTFGCGSGGAGGSTGNGGNGGGRGGGGGGASSAGSGTAGNTSIAIITYTPVVPASSISWDPASAYSITPSNYNLTATQPNSGGQAQSLSYQPIGGGPGKYYFEVYLNADGASFGVGIADITSSFLSSQIDIGTCANVAANVSIWNGAANGTVIGSLTGPAQGDVLCFAIDTVNNGFWYRLNGGTWNGSGTANPATGVGGVKSTASYAAVFVAMDMIISGGASQITLNAGGYAYAQAVPSGYVNWPLISTPPSSGNQAIIMG